MRNILRQLTMAISAGLAVAMLTVGIVALAANTAANPPASNSLAPAQNCTTNVAVLSAKGMDSSQAFGITQDNTKPTRPLVELTVKLTDANTSITRFDTTCTTSRDDNATDITPQTVQIVDGIATQNDSLKFRKTSPGTKNFLVSFDLLAMPDFECTFSVGAGSGASIDLITVDVRMCSR